MDFLIILSIHLLIFILLLILIIKYRNTIAIIIFIVYIIVYWRTILIAILLIGLLGKFILLNQFETRRNIRKLFNSDIKELFSNILGLKIHGNMPNENDRVICVVNYPANHFEYLLIGLFKAKLLARKFNQVGPLKFFSQLIYDKDNYVEVNKNVSNFDNIKYEIANYSKLVIAYVENQRLRENIYTLTPLRTGIFHISQELNIPIVPIVIDHMKYDSTGHVNNKSFNIFIGPRFHPHDFSSVNEYLNIISQWMQSRLSLCQSF